MHWTDERIQLLRKLWSEGFSASQIANQLGGVSRNAVIGKVHRIKLSGRGRTTATPARKKKPANQHMSPSQKVAAKQLGNQRHVIPAFGGNIFYDAPVDAEPAKPRIIIRPAENVVVPISRQLRLDDLTERTCKWPNGDPLEENFNFCGNDAAEAGPYCKYHSRVAFQPAAERRRSR
jgi:GcrA cell cycle regulator